MKPVKRCDDPVIALLLILLTVKIRITFQIISRIVISVPVPRRNRHYPVISPSFLKRQEIEGKQ